MFWILKERKFRKVFNFRPKNASRKKVQQAIDKLDEEFKRASSAFNDAISTGELERLKVELETIALNPGKITAKEFKDLTERTLICTERYESLEKALIEALKKLTEAYGLARQFGYVVNA